MPKRTNCIVHGRERYRIRKLIGHDENGKDIYKSFYGDGKLEAEAAMEDYMERMSSGLNDSEATLGALAKYYTYNIMIYDKLAPGTIELYERQYRLHLKSAPMMMRPVIELRKSDLQQYIVDLASGKYEKDGKKPAQSAVKNLIQYLKKLFAYLDMQGYCNNLMDGTTTPNVKDGKAIESTKEIEVFSKDEIAKIISNDKDNRLHFLFVLALATGLREGELLALKYDDLKDGKVVVNKQLNEHYKIDSDGYREPASVIREPKSRASYRTVSMPENVILELADHKARHNAEMMKTGYRTEYVFTTSTGKFLNKGNFRHAWRRHLKKAGVPYCKFHACRATYCTMLCINGVPLETASKLMGHSDINVTASFYRFVGSKEMESAADKINSLFIVEPTGDQLATGSEK
jgi:integrase